MSLTARYTGYSVLPRQGCDALGRGKTEDQGGDVVSTSGAIRIGRAGAGAGRRGDPYAGSNVYVAGSPRRDRQQQRAVLLLVICLAVLVPIGLQIHRSMADATSASGELTAGDAVTGQQGVLTGNGDAGQAQPPPEPGAIDPSLSRAIGKAQTAAQAAGVDLQVTSGFRSAATQQRLYDQAIAKYGSPQTARHWVLPPAESAHVRGLAVDVGPPAAAAWLDTHGVHFGLCRRYVNESWHFERLAPAIGQQCPAMEPYAGG